jgi:hypothetical protein
MAVPTKLREDYYETNEKIIDFGNGINNMLKWSIDAAVKC